MPVHVWTPEQAENFRLAELTLAATRHAVYATWAGALASFVAAAVAFVVLHLSIKAERRNIEEERQRVARGALASVETSIQSLRHLQAEIDAEHVGLLWQSQALILQWRLRTLEYYLQRDVLYYDVVQCVLRTRMAIEQTSNLWDAIEHQDFIDPNGHPVRALIRAEAKRRFSLLPNEIQMLERALEATRRAVGAVSIIA